MQDETNKIISLAEASNITGYTQDYLGFLCRTGKLEGQKIGRNWTTTRSALQQMRFDAELTSGPSQVQEHSSLGGTKIPVKVLQPSDLYEGEHHGQILNPLPSTQYSTAVIPSAVEESVSSLIRTNERDTSVLVETAEDSSPTTFEKTFVVGLPIALSTIEKNDSILNQKQDNVFNNLNLRSNQEKFRGQQVFTTFAIILSVLAGIFLLKPSLLQNLINNDKQTSVVTFIPTQAEKNKSDSDSNKEGQVLAALSVTEARVTPAVLTQFELEKSIMETLATAESLGFFQGPQGPAGTNGTSGTSPSGPIYIQPYIPSVPTSSNPGGTLAGFTDLSSQRFITEDAIINDVLTVNGTASFAGDVEVTGTITAGGITGTINPGLTSGSLLFQGGAGIAQDNANLFWDDTDNQLSIGTASANASAILQIDSTTMGLLPPRLTTVQKNAIASPATGLTLYDSTLNKLNVYNGTTWKNVGSAEIGGEITSGTTGSILFVGAGATIAQDNANFFWDADNARLGLGTATPEYLLDMRGSHASTPSLQIKAVQTTPGNDEVSLKVGAYVDDADSSIGYSWINTEFTNPSVTFGYYPLILNSGGGRVGIGTDTSPDYQLEVSNGSFGAVDPSFALSDGSVAHGLTTIANTDVLFHMAPLDSSNGGTRITAISDTDAQALSIRGIIGSTDPTDTTAAILFTGAKSNGTTGIADLGNSETVLQVVNNDNTAALTILGSGNVGIGIITPQSTLHTYGTLRVGGNSATNQTGTIVLGNDTTTDQYVGIYRGTTAGVIGGGNALVLGGYDGLAFHTSQGTLGSQTQRLLITEGGNIGFNTSSWGANSSKVIAVGAGTAPTVSPADVSQLWTADWNGAGTNALFLRTEEGTQHVFGSNVGISTTTPRANLEVYGAMRYGGSTPISATTVSDNPLTSGATTVNVSSTTGYATSGTLVIEAESMTYTGISGNAFTGVTRGVLGTTAASHASGARIDNYLSIAQRDDTNPKFTLTASGRASFGRAVPSTSYTGGLYPTLEIGSLDATFPQAVPGSAYLSLNSGAGAIPGLVFARNSVAQWSIVDRHDDPGRLSFMNAGSGQTFNFLQNGSFGINDTSPDANLEVVNDASGDSFLVADGGDGDTTPFVIQSNGDVGIGNANPAQKLHVGDGNNPAFASEGLIRVGASNGAGQYREWDFGTNTSVSPYSFIIKQSAASTASLFIDYAYDRTGIGPGASVSNAKLSVLNAETAIGASMSTILSSNAGSTFNTTAGAYTSYGGNFTSTSTRSAGANALTNVGLYASASGAQNNYAALFDNGNVGIGETSPAAALTVGLDTTAGVANGAGDVYVQNDLEVDGTLTVAGATTYSGALSVITTTSPQLTVGYDSSNKFTTAVASDGGTTWAMLGTDADLNVDFSGATDGDFSINTDDLFVDTSTGYVGIGTNNLSSIESTYNRLIVQGSDAAAVGQTIINTGVGQVAFGLTRTGGTASRWLTYLPTGSTDLRLWNAADLVTFQADGEVGIGTASPTALLDVNNTTSTAITAGANARILNLQGAFTEAGSGTHSRIAGMEITPPTITAGVATVTNTASLYISDAPTATVTGANYSLWVDSGNSRFDGALQLNGGSFPSAGEGLELIASNDIGYIQVYNRDIASWGDLQINVEDLTFQNNGGFATFGGSVGIGGGDLTPDASLEINNDSSGDSFLVNDSGDGDTTPFVIQADGDVGIGTTAPLSGKLDIRGPLGTASWKTSPTDGTGGYNFGFAFVQDTSTFDGTIGYFRMVDTDGTLVSGRNIIGLQFASGGDHLLVQGNNGLVDISASNKFRFCGGSGTCATASELQANKIRLSPSFGTADGLTDPGDGGVHFPGNSYFATSTGSVGIGTASPDGKLEIAGNVSLSAWGLNGIQLQGTAATFTDTSTAAAGTATNAVFTSFGQPTLAASNLSVTTTNAATVYIAAAPAAGTNQTITNAYALWIDAGTARFDGYVTAPGAGGLPDQSERFGYGAAAGQDGTALGYNANAGAAGVAIGKNSVSATSSTAVGQGASANNFVSTAIGSAASANSGYDIALGYGATTTAASQFVAGSNTAPITNVYIGNGVTNTAPSGFVLQGSGGSGTDIAGASVTIAGGKATGNAAGGDILFQTSDASASGATLQSLTTKMTLTELGNLGIGTTAPAGKLNVSATPTATANYGLVSIGAGPWDGSTAGYYAGDPSGTVLAINTPSYVGTNLRIQEAGVDILYLAGNTAGAATMNLGTGFAGPIINNMSSDGYGMTYKQTGLGIFSVGTTGASSTGVLYYDGANQWTLLAPTDNASYTKVLTINAKTTLTTAGAKLLSLQNNGSENAFVDKDGGGYFAGATGIGDLTPDALFDIDSTATTTNVAGILSSTLTTGELMDLTATYAPTDGSDNEALDINLTYTPTTSAGTFRGIDLNVTEGANALANTDYALKVTLDNSANTSTGTHTVYGGHYTATGKTAGTTTAVGLYATASGADNNYAALFDAGNVGIGDTTPDEKLSVVAGTLGSGLGAFKASGTFPITSGVTAYGANFDFTTARDSDTSVNYAMNVSLSSVYVAADGAGREVGGIRVTTTDPGGNATLYGIKVDSAALGGDTSYGVYSKAAFGGNYSYGVYGTTQGGPTAVGVYGESSNVGGTRDSYGGMFRIVGNVTQNAYGVYSSPANAPTITGTYYGMYSTINGATVTGAKAAGLFTDGTTTSTFNTGTYAALFSGGNVGIGDTTPDAPLHVVGSTIGAIIDGSNGSDLQEVLTIRRSDVTSRFIKFFPSYLGGGSRIEFANQAGPVAFVNSANVTGYTFDKNVGAGVAAPGASLDIDMTDASSITAEQILFRSNNTAQTLTDGTTIASWRANQFTAPTLNGVAAGGTETVTNAATVYISAAPSGSNITITNPYALWVDSGTSRFDGDVNVGSEIVFDTYGRIYAGTAVSQGYHLSLDAGFVVTPRSGTPSAVGMVVQGLASQGGDLTQWRNSSATVLATVNPRGEFQIKSPEIIGTATFELTGDIDPAASTTVTGSGTFFSNEIQVGDRITVSGETRTVTAIASQTSLTVDTAFSDNANDTTPDRLPVELSVLDSSGNIDFIVQDNGNVGIGVATPGYKFDVQTNTASTYSAYFFNDGNDANRYGIQIQGGADDASGTTYYLRALDGDGGEVGYIANTSGTFALTDSSDVRTKTNITNTIEEGLATIMQLRVVDFNRLADPDGPRITGFIAQEVNEVYPKIVNESPNGYLGISKENLIPILVKAMQEQQAELQSVKSLAQSLQGLGNGILQVDSLVVNSHVAFNEDTVGQAKILGTDSKVRISFTKEYEYQPVVTVTPMEFATIPYRVTEVDVTGFTIEFASVIGYDVTFNWHSFGSKEGKLTISDGTKQDIAIIVPQAPNPNVAQIQENNLAVDGSTGDQPPTENNIIDGTGVPQILEVPNGNSSNDGSGNGNPNTGLPTIEEIISDAPADPQPGA